MTDIDGAAPDGSNTSKDVTIPGFLSIEVPSDWTVKDNGDGGELAKCKDETIGGASETGGLWLPNRSSVAWSREILTPTGH
ncbi:MAG TPA: hypothetical protein GXX40_07460 [Firmicutes bacterium]|nr:hypothetical protein [Bacillota bacterium]